MSEIQKYGVENLKKAVKFALDFTKQAAEASKDGFTWKDSFGFFGEVAQLPGLLNSGNDIVNELKELSADERNELNVYVQQNFEIDNDKVEVVVKEALNIAFSALVLVSAFKPQPQSPTPPAETTV